MHGLIYKSFFRIAVSPVIYNLVMSGNYELALYLNLFSAVSDFLDGKIARTWPSQQSTLGKLSLVGHYRLFKRLWLVYLRPKDNLFWIRVGWPSLTDQINPFTFFLTEHVVWIIGPELPKVSPRTHWLWLIVNDSRTVTVISGTALDPLADKITMLFIYSAFYLHNDIPSWLFMTIIGRDIALVRHSLVQKWPD